MNFLMSLYSSRVLNVFGFGMNEIPFLRMFRCVLVLVGSVASNYLLYLYLHLTCCMVQSKIH